MVLDSGFFPPEMNAQKLGKSLAGMYRHWDPLLTPIIYSGLTSIRGKKVKELSRGMVMKLSLAVALSHGARLLLLDEATSGLTLWCG